MNPEQTLNTVISNIPTYFSVEDYVKDKLVTLYNFMNNKKYAILLTTQDHYSLATYLETSSLQEQGRIVCVLPLQSNYPEKRVADNPRYHPANYQNIQEDFGTVDFSNFYSQLAPIRLEPAFALDEHTLLNQHINQAGELELFTIRHGEDADGIRTDLYQIERVLEPELAKGNWTFYTPKEEQTQQAIIGPTHSGFLKNYFLEHGKQ